MSEGVIDSHCHLSDKVFAGDLEGTIARAHEAGVARIVAVGGGGPVEDSETSADIARSHDSIRATAGIHPHDAKNYTDETELRLQALLERAEVTAVGETGLDYHYEYSPRRVQRKALARHLALAVRYRKPVVIHCREAESDFVDVWDSEGPIESGGVMHCYTGGYKDACKAIDRGLLISFSGILTFRSSDDLRDTARRLPLDRLMVETDSPFLAPEPHRGKHNEPAFVIATARVLAEIHGVAYEEVARTTSANALATFFPARD